MILQIVRVLRGTPAIWPGTWGKVGLFRGPTPVPTRIDHHTIMSIT